MEHLRKVRKQTYRLEQGYNVSLCPLPGMCVAEPLLGHLQMPRGSHSLSAWWHLSQCWPHILSTAGEILLGEAKQQEHQSEVSGPQFSSWLPISYAIMSKSGFLKKVL